ncbi:hypothetical protein MRB53_042379 [Persea americana]|nr:hypothetical protein MRB53_042379 [Persea americana]
MCISRCHIPPTHHIRRLARSVIILGSFHLQERLQIDLAMSWQVFGVDNEVTHPTEYDFYLLSHAGLQGTSRPTHYRVLMDENKMSPDDLQTLTYNLTYMYSKCTRSVSLVPAVMYADQIALLDRYHYNASSRMGSETGSFTDAPSSGTGLSEEEVNRYYAGVKTNLRDISMYW